MNDHPETPPLRSKDLWGWRIVITLESHYKWMPWKQVTCFKKDFISKVNARVAFKFLKGVLGGRRI